jgi:hypothetical protein
MRRLQKLPLADDVLSLEARQNLIRNLLEVGGGQCQDGGAGTGETDSEQTWVGLGGDGCQDFGQAGNLSIPLAQIPAKV